MSKKPSILIDELYVHAINVNSVISATPGVLCAENCGRGVQSSDCSHAYVGELICVIGERGWGSLRPVESVSLDPCLWFGDAHSWRCSVTCRISQTLSRLSATADPIAAMRLLPWPMDYVTPVTPASNHVAQSSTWCFLFMMLFLYPECLVLQKWLATVRCVVHVKEVFNGG